MRLPASDAQQIFIVVRLDPDGPSFARAVLDTMNAATQRQKSTASEGRSARQPSQPRRYPGTVRLRGFPCVLDTATLRHCEHDFAAGHKDPQGVAARLPMAANTHRMDLAVTTDCNRRGLVGPAIEQGAERYRYH